MSKKNALGPAQGLDEFKHFTRPVTSQRFWQGWKTACTLALTPGSGKEFDDYASNIMHWLLCCIEGNANFFPFLKFVMVWCVRIVKEHLHGCKAVHSTSLAFQGDTENQTDELIALIQMASKNNSFLLLHNKLSVTRSQKTVRARNSMTS